MSHYWLLSYADHTLSLISPRVYKLNIVSMGFSEWDPKRRWFLKTGLVLGAGIALGIAGNEGFEKLEREKQLLDHYKGKYLDAYISGFVSMLITSLLKI